MMILIILLSFPTYEEYIIRKNSKILEKYSEAILFLDSPEQSRGINYLTELLKSSNEKIKILKEADYYFIQALRDHGLYHKIWQAYAALLPVKTVGVMGDNRTYEYLCLLRAITSEDGMTADFFEFRKSFMQTISNKIVNSIRGINRVVYDVTSKPPSTIELE